MARVAADDQCNPVEAVASETRLPQISTSFLLVFSSS